MKSLRAIASLSFAAAMTVLVACSGGGGGSSPTFSPPTTNPGPSNPPPTNPPPNTTISSSAIGVSGQITVAPNGVQGSQSWYNGGVTAWASNAGDTGSGGSGTNTVDGVSCTQMGEPTGTSLHVHAFVGMYVNGTQQAIPSAIGMWNPTQPTSGGLANDNQAVPSASCFYHLHTHDYSGLIHIEDSTVAQSFASGPVSYAKLKTLFDIWGEPINASQVATFNGKVAIYIGTPSAPTAPSGADMVHAYTPFNGDLTTIALGHHVAIWIVVGTPPAALPQIIFGIEE